MKPFLLILTLVTGFYACSPIQVLDQEPVDDFTLSNYRTFSFYEIDTGGDSLRNRMYRPSIAALKTQITQQLQMRGLQPAGDSDPDLLVNIGIMIQQKIRNQKDGGLRYMGQRRYNTQNTLVETGQHYNEGTVTVHLVDRAENKLVWRGAVEGVVPNKQASLERNVADAMEALFKGL